MNDRAKTLLELAGEGMRANDPIPVLAWLKQTKEPSLTFYRQRLFALSVDGGHDAVALAMVPFLHNYEMALEAAARRGRLNVVAAVLPHTMHSLTALFEAVQQGHAHVLAYLLAHQSYDVDHRQTALRHACVCNHPQLVEILCPVGNAGIVGEQLVAEGHSNSAIQTLLLYVAAQKERRVLEAQIAGGCSGAAGGEVQEGACAQRKIAKI